MRKFVVGDIRGDFKLFQKMMDRLGPTSSDVVIFLGSYLGPGGNSKDCVDYALGLRTAMPSTFLFLRGCYEYMFGRCIGTKPAESHLNLWKHMRGEKVFNSYCVPGPRLVSGGVEQLPLNVPASHLRFFEGELHQWFEDELFPFVATHSGYHPSLYKDAKEEYTVFSVNRWWENDNIRIPGKTIVFSHVPFKEPFLGKGKLGIDLGAGLGGKLAAWEAVSQQIITVE
jgi:hypothetical protein